MNDKILDFLLYVLLMLMGAVAIGLTTFGVFFVLFGLGVLQ